MIYTTLTRRRGRPAGVFVAAVIMLTLTLVIPAIGSSSAPAGAGGIPFTAVTAACRHVDKTIATALPAAGASFTNDLGMTFIYIQPGKLMMGSPDNEPARDNDEKRHQVTLTSGFYMQTTEVTQGQWQAIMGDNPSHFSGCGGDCPVEQVSWNDVREFIRKLNLKNGRVYRLPTEAEWEYACRAGTTGPFSTGDCLSTDQADYDGRYPLPGCSEGRHRQTTVAVKRFEPNPWGLYDMHGNVWEWCADWYEETYRLGRQTDPAGPPSGQDRVFRGGGWSSGARGCRSADRNHRPSDFSNSIIGFRLVTDQ